MNDIKELITLNELKERNPTFADNICMGIKVYLGNHKGLHFYFTPEDEHCGLTEVFKDSFEEIDSIQEKIDRNDLVYFCAKVHSEIEGFTISSDYLGGCIYKSYKEFLTTKGCCFEDMLNTVYYQGLSNLQKLRDKIDEVI